MMGTSVLLYIGFANTSQICVGLLGESEGKFLEGRKSVESVKEEIEHRPGKMQGEIRARDFQISHGNALHCR